MNIDLEEIIENVRVVDTKRDYWFFRTYSGELYKEFYNTGYIGLGLNNVPYNYIKEAQFDDPPTFDRLQKFIDNNTSYKKGEATKLANQLISFEHSIKIGDMVIIPSKNSDEYAFGIVEGNTVVKESQTTFQFDGKYEPFPEKLKKVKWLKEISKEDLQGELRGLSSSHQALTNANRYSELIEGNLSSLYIKEGQMYLTVMIDQEEDINAFDLQRFLYGLTYFYKEFCEEYGIEYNEDLSIKIKLQSKGKLALYAAAGIALAGLSGMVLMSNNPEMSFKIKGIEFSAKGDGFFKSHSDYKDREQEREMEKIIFLDSMERLKVRPIPDPVTKAEDSIEVKKDSTLAKK